jgi:hypothetical protein
MKIQSPWMGRIKGSAGNMTGCKVYDKNVMRAKAFEVNNPNTAAQQVQRGYFADLTKLVAGFTPDQLRTLFPSKPKAMSRRNALSKQLAEYNTMQGSEKVVDFANIDTLGNAPTHAMPNAEISLTNGFIEVAYDGQNQIIQENANCAVCVCVINETKKEIKLVLLDEEASVGGSSFQNNFGWESTDHLDGFIMLTNTTVLDADFGSFIIKVRPEKKSK